MICWDIKRELFQNLSFDAMSPSFLTRQERGGVRFLRSDSRRPMAPCPFGHEAQSMRHRRIDRRMAAAIGEAVGGDVDDPHHERPAECASRMRQRQTR